MSAAVGDGQVDEKWAEMMRAAGFARDESIEVATGDESSTTVLSFVNGGITLENAQVAVATLNPAKAFGASAFGPLQFRVVAKGAAGCSAAGVGGFDSGPARPRSHRHHRA